MRSLLRVLILVPALALLALPALAEDEPAAPAPDAKPKPDPTIPDYSIEFLMPSEDKTPEGWALGGSAPSGAPAEDGLTELAEGCGLDDETFYVETAVLKKGGDTVAIAMVDVDEKVWTYRAKLDAQASAAGWVVRELGSPARLLVASGSAAQSVIPALIEHVVYALSEMGMNRVRGRSGSEAAGREAALEYTQAIDRVAPDSGVAHAIRGIVDWIKSRPTRERKEVDRPVEDKALAAFDKALADGVAYPPKGSVRVFVAGQLGGILLARKDKTQLARATRALEIAVEHEKDGKDNVRRFGHRYDLACAYARADRIKEAFAMLEKSIEVGKYLPPARWRASFKHMEEKDPDMAPLRKDPRFSKLMADNRPPEPKRRPMPKNHPPVDDDDKPKDKPKDGR